MSIWSLLQIALNLFFVLAISILWLKSRKKAKDDPRLSRGLQLLQSKISVLEDLSDRTEVQVKQLTTLLEKKCRLIQSKIQEAEVHTRKIEQTMAKSLEVAEIFQDKIPHEEIIERQNTVKYINAARMAHSGHSADEIASATGLSQGEVEFITKVNKDELLFSDELLPEWAKPQPAESESSEAGSFTEEPADDRADSSADQWEVSSSEVEEDSHIDFSRVFEVPKQDYSSLKKLGEEFRRACDEYRHSDEPEGEPSIKPPSQILQTAREVRDRLVDRASHLLENRADSSDAENTDVQAETASDKSTPARPASVRTKSDPVVRKVEFPRIDVNNNLG